MKTMKNLAAQQLSKKQMNEIKGGKHICDIYTANGVFVRRHEINGASSSLEAAEVLSPFYGDGYYAVCGHVVEG